MSPRPISLLVILFLLTFAPAVARSGQGSAPDTGALAILRGHVVCLDSTGKELSPLFECKQSDRFLLKTTDGKQYRFVAGDSETAVFTDSRVRQRNLQITAKLHAGGQLELIKVQSVRDGKLYDISYFCELCNIRLYAPGLCPCCRNELEFREVPAESGRTADGN